MGEFFAGTELFFFFFLSNMNDICFLLGGARFFLVTHFAAKKMSEKM